jgi:hypothetical protein
LTTNSNGRYNDDTANFIPAASIGDTLYIEAKKDTLGKSFKAKAKKIIGGSIDLYEITLDNLDKNVRAFTWNIDEFKDTTNYANTTITPLFWLNKNPGQKTIAELDTISNGLSSHPHYHDSWGNLQMQDSTWAQGDSASVLFQKNYILKAFPDSIPYSLLNFGIDTTFWDAQLVKDTLKFPTDVSIKDWSIDSLFTTTAVNDSVEPKAFIRNNRTSLPQYAFPDSAKFYLTITGDGVNYSDSLVKRLDSGMNDTITFKKSYKGNGSCTLRCSTSVFGDATPTNNVKQWITSGPMGVEAAPGPGPSAGPAFRAYPNPVRDIRNIRLNKAGVYGVYNIAGQKLGTAEANSTGQMQWQLNGEIVSGGVYFVVKQDTKETQRVQVVR